ncbi:hypothetical protein JB92DRAFT_80301 [Gautieria morchelliformis]|nr:hypothetical protein JB92DRAFT_80301 [Gautieria morchelliformis]
MFSLSPVSTRRRRPRGPLPSETQIIRTAEDVVSSLKTLGIDACFIGSMACLLFGNTRKPNDLDVLCLTQIWEQEALKSRLVELNPKFYLVPSRNPRATYKVLWYHISETDSCLKVDILLPGVLDIPDVPLPDIDRNNNSGLPCAPLSHLLLLKLQGWIHHGESALLRDRLKQPQDVRDVDELLVIAVRRGLKPREEGYLPQSFIRRAELRVEKYVNAYPASRANWIALGFVLPEGRTLHYVDTLW